MAAVPQQIIGDLYLLLTSESQQSRFYFNRSVGYQHEFEFSQLCDRLNIQTLDGGMFLMRNNPDYHGVYVTISGGNKDDYLPLYSQLRSIRRESVSQMFFGEIRGWNNNPATIRIKDGTALELDIEHPTQNGTIPVTNPQEKSRQRSVDVQITTPEIDFFEYDGTGWGPSDIGTIRGNFDARPVRVGARKETFLDYMIGYPADFLRDIYCNRFFLDHMLAGIKPYMCDIDKVIVRDGKYELVEVKNKTPVFAQVTAAQRRQGIQANDLQRARFGWDFRRFAWYLYLKQQTGLDIRFVVARIDDRIHRNTIEWKDMTIDDWCTCADWSQDMNGNQMAPYAEFEENFRIP